MPVNGYDVSALDSFLSALCCLLHSTAPLVNAPAPRSERRTLHTLPETSPSLPFPDPTRTFSIPKCPNPNAYIMPTSPSKRNHPKKSQLSKTAQSFYREIKGKMRSPFFASPSNPTRYGYVPHPRPRPPAAKPRVVSIPVHFVSSEEEERTAKKPAAAAAARQTAEVDRTGAAVKVQKVFRGFLVRKNVRAVHKIAAEVDEIERKIRAEEELIRRDGKERLRVNEMLMALLLRLDSVRGVRDYRKKVIRRVISLQDAVDSITAARDEKEVGGETLGAENGAPAKTLESPEEVVEHRIDEEAVPQECGDGISEIHGGSAKGFGTLDVEKEEAKAEGDDSVEETLEAKDEAPESKDLAEGSVLIESKSVEEGNIGDPMEETLGNAPESTAPEEAVEESNPMEQERAPEIGAEEGSARSDQMQGVGGSPGVKEVMERVIAENERLKRLVAEICERSTQQCRLMGGLVERVERLERRMEKRKKKKNAKRRLAEDKYHLCS